MVAEQRHHLLALAEPQQAVIDEHAGEPVADRLVDQHRRDRGIDAARQAADHPALPDLPADLGDRLVAECAHAPVAHAAGNVAHEVAQERGAVGRVHHFEVELGGVEPARVVGDDGDRRIRRCRHRPEAGRRMGHPVAMAHPHRIALALAPDAVEQCAAVGHLDLGAAELAGVAALHFAAELFRHRLLAVADAEHRHAGVKQRRRRHRGVTVEHRGGAAGQDHAAGLHLGKGLARLLERRDLAVDALLAHPPGDQLRDLGTEIDDEDLLVQGLLIHVRGLAGLSGAAEGRAEAAMCGAPPAGSSPGQESHHNGCFTFLDLEARRRCNATDPALRRA